MRRCIGLCCRPVPLALPFRHDDAEKKAFARWAFDVHTSPSLKAPPLEPRVRACREKLTHGTRFASLPQHVSHPQFDTAACLE